MEIQWLYNIKCFLLVSFLRLVFFTQEVIRFRLIMIVIFSYRRKDQRRAVKLVADY